MLKNIKEPLMSTESVGDNHLSGATAKVTDEYMNEGGDSNLPDDTDWEAEIQKVEFKDMRPFDKNIYNDRYIKEENKEVRVENIEGDHPIALPKLAAEYWQKHGGKPDLSAEDNVVRWAYHMWQKKIGFTDDEVPEDNMMWMHSKDA